MWFSWLNLLLYEIPRSAERGEGGTSCTKLYLQIFVNRWQNMHKNIVACYFKFCTDAYFWIIVFANSLDSKREQVLKKPPKTYHQNNWLKFFLNIFYSFAYLCLIV